MQDLKEYLILAGAACLCGLLIVVLRNSKTARKFVLNSVAGIAALGTVNLTAALTGIGLAVNVWTLLIACLLGLPGVTGVMFLKLIWKL